MGAGMLMLYNISNPATHHAHFGGSAFKLSQLGFDTKMTIYAGFLALIVNLIVTVAGTLIARAVKATEGVDGTRPTDYTANEGDPTVRELKLTANT